MSFETSNSLLYCTCRSVHLCEPCCRREHELAAVASSLLATTAAATASHTHAAELITAGSAHYEGKRHYALRHHREYEFMCDNLRVVNVSLMETLNTAPLESGIMCVHVCVCVCVCVYVLGCLRVCMHDSIFFVPNLYSLCIPLERAAIRVEAAVDYYESLRMARIINHTRTDPASLNIDLDHFMGECNHLLTYSFTYLLTYLLTYFLTDACTLVYAYTHILTYS